MMKIRHAYSRERGPKVKFTEPSMTKQSFKASCDINNILVKYQKTGVFDHVRKYEGQYFDATETEYHDAMNTVVQAEQMFQELPAKARDYFHNDPGRFLAFFDENGEQSTELLYELGLAIGTKNGADMHPNDARYEGQPTQPKNNDVPSDSE